MGTSSISSVSSVSFFGAYLWSFSGHFYFLSPFLIIFCRNFAQIIANEPNTLLVLFHLLFLIVGNMFKLGWSYKRNHLAENLPGLVKVEVNIYQILSFSLPGLSRPFIPTTEIRNLTTQTHPPTSPQGGGGLLLKEKLLTPP